MIRAIVSSASCVRFLPLKRRGEGQGLGQFVAGGGADGGGVGHWGTVGEVGERIKNILPLCVRTLYTLSASFRKATVNLLFSLT